MKTFFAYPGKLISGVCMLAALLWLSFGTSLVYLKMQDKITKVSVPQDHEEDTDDPANPFDSTEDQSENCPNVLTTEYLQQDQVDLLYSDIPLKHLKSHYTNAFINFHGEFFSPPPELVS